MAARDAGFIPRPGPLVEEIATVTAFPRNDKGWRARRPPHRDGRGTTRKDRLMGFFLYYVPGAPALPTGEGVYASLLDKLGLATTLSGTTCESVKVEQNGPDGGPGVVFVPHVAVSPCEGTHRCGVYADAQTWIPGPKDDAGDGKGSVRYWIGYFNDAVPGPDDLSRGCTLYSREREMGDGRMWRVPVAETLPLRRMLDAEGEDIAVPRAEHRAFHALANEFLEMVLPHSADMTEMPEWEIERYWALAAGGLGLLYRVDVFECKVLGLLEVGGDSSLINVCLDTIGYSLVVADMEALEDEEAPEKKSA